MSPAGNNRSPCCADLVCPLKEWR
uniref:Predicted protein n=1 Tax=Hordeum vulgare subsp. vulgare TaxID=112509 RepID=F2CXS6_HORVV|nr:predicted protein [Hordeum vulgare subsp. vulgare]